MKRFFEKISLLFINLGQLYKQNLAQVVFLGLLLWVFVLVRQLPYFNIIPQYNFYVSGIYIVLIVALFRKQLSSKKLFLIAEGMIILALFAELVLITSLVEFLGFIIFCVLLISTLIEFFSQRKNLKKF